MEHFDRLVGLLRYTELDKGEATGASCHLVEHQVDAHDDARTTDWSSMSRSRT